MQQITGTIIQKMQPASGVSKSGNPWCKAGFVVEYRSGEYSRKAMFYAFGQERVDKLAAIPANTQVTVSFSPESREYEGRWYTELRAVSFDTVQYAAPSQQPVQQPAAPEPPRQPVQQLSDTHNLQHILEEQNDLLF